MERDRRAGVNQHSLLPHAAIVLDLAALGEHGCHGSRQVNLADDVGLGKQDDGREHRERLPLDESLPLDRKEPFRFESQRECLTTVNRQRVLSLLVRQCLAVLRMPRDSDSHTRQ